MKPLYYEHSIAIILMIGELVHIPQVLKFLLRLQKNSHSIHLIAIILKQLLTISLLIEQHLSIDEYYTSDYDLSEYNANQYGFGIAYTDIFAKFKILGYGLKSVDIKYSLYNRNTTFSSSIITAGIKFVDE